MTNKKESHPHGMSDETAEMLSKAQRRDKEKPEQKHYPIQDQRKEARKKHTNGSKPANQS